MEKISKTQSSLTEELMKQTKRDEWKTETTK